MSSWKRHLLAMAVATSVVGFGMSAEAAQSGFLTEAPAADCAQINQLIATGKIDGYDQQIPSGQSISRLELAMIINDAMQNWNAFTPAEQSSLDSLRKKYLYDIKKLELLNRLDKLDNSSLQAIERGNIQQKRDPDEIPYTKQEKDRVDKMADILDKVKFSAHTRIRNDHRVRKNHLTGQKTRSTRANHILVTLVTDLKANDRWSVHTSLDYRQSMNHPTLYTTDNDGATKVFSGGHDEGEALGKHFNPDVWVTGNLPNHIDIKAGRWNEWTVPGHGFDVDCDVTGGEIDFGNKLRVHLAALKIDFWDYGFSGNNSLITTERATAATNYLTSHGEGFNGAGGEDFFGIRFDYPFAEKSHAHVGINWTSAMPACYQDPVQRDRVMSYYAHATHYFGERWRADAGIIYSNAKAIPAQYIGFEASKDPGIWLGITYGTLDIQKRGTYDAWLTYRQEPGLTWSTYTDWWSANERGFRVGFDYMLDKNFMFTTWASMCKDIDSKDENNLWRFQVDYFL